MADNGLVAQVDGIAARESDLAVQKQQLSRALWLAREIAGLSLRDVAPRVRLTAAGLSYIERGKRWSTKTVRRVARFYDSLAA